MKHKRLFSAFFALFIAVVICAEPCLLSKVASAKRACPADTVSVADSGMTIEGTNSFGDLFAAELSEKQEEQLANNSYQIYSVEMDGSTATVDFQVAQDCTLVVGIYDEDEVTLLGTGTAEVTPGQNIAEIDISVSEMPQYFYVKGYLCDTSSLEPLCVVYENPNYTQEMQEFFSKTTDDFEAERVLNFDDDKTKNFAVYDENTIVIPENEGNNIVTSVDGENAVYVIENADENFLSLKEGDIFTYQYGENGLIIAKVAAIETDGTTVKITGAEISMQDAFEFVRIEQEQGTDEAVISGFTFEDDTPSGSSAQEIETIADDEQPSSDGTGLDVDGNVTFEGDTIKGNATIHAMISKDFEFDSTKYSKSDNVFKIKGNFSADEITSFNLYCKFYIHKDDQYVEIKLDYSAKLIIDTEVDTAESIPMPTITFAPCPGVHLSFTPIFEVNGNVKTHLEDTLTGAIGFRASTQTGIADLSESPVFRSQIDVAGELYIGLSFESNINLISEIIDKVSLTGGGGVQLKAEYHFDTSVDLSTGEKIPDGDAYILHTDGGCLHGYATAKFRIKASVSFLSSKKWLKFDLPKDGEKTTEIVLSYFYRCDCGQKGTGFLGNQLDGLCPHNIFRITMHVEDSEGNPISNAQINANVEGALLDEESQPVTRTTDETGTATFFIRPFTLDQSSNVIYTIKSNGYQTTEIEISVTDLIELYSNFFESYLLGNNPQSLLDIISRKTVILESKNSVPDVPTGAQKVTQVSLGSYHSAAITEDGSLYTWGYNYEGQLGNGTTEDSSIPIKIMDNVKSVSLGGEHSAAITNDGSLYMWGYNCYGQLGNGTTESSYIPIKIMDNVKSVSLGGGHSAAITKNGSLYMWGGNEDGELGNGTTEDSSIPIKIMDNVKSVSLGGEHSAAITEDGSLYTWGTVWINGQIESSSLIPIKIMDNAKSVSLGTDHSAATTEDGSLYTWGSWGYQDNGELGNGTTEDNYALTKIMNNVKSLSLGGCHSAAITEDGSLYMWGDNYLGELGNGTIEDSFVPIKIMDNVKSVSLGEFHSAAITEGGDLYMWGENYRGEFGNGESGGDYEYYDNGIDSNIPIKIEIPYESAMQIKTAEAVTIQSSSLTELLPNTLYNYYVLFAEDTEPLLTAENLCYITQFVTDFNGTAELDTGETYIPEDAVVRMVPVKVTYEQPSPDPSDTDTNTEITTTTAAIVTTTMTSTETTTDSSLTHPGGLEGLNSKKIKQISAGSNISAALTEDGELYMWGSNYYGSLGNGICGGSDSKYDEGIDSNVPVKVMGNVKAVSLGEFHSAAVTEDGSLYLWGNNGSGRLGNGTNVNSSIPIKIMNHVKSVSLGYQNSAAITEDGSLYMWGANYYGQLGNGTTDESYSPVKIMDNVKSVSLGDYHSAAITEDGSLYLWGYNDYGQLGDGTTSQIITPMKIMDEVSAISMGGAHSAAITLDGTLYAWGKNEDGQLGIGSDEVYVTHPMPILDNVASVSLSGGCHSSAVTANGDLWIWGANWHGQLGNGNSGGHKDSLDSVDSTVPINIMDGAISCTLGYNHTIALTESGRLLAWGYNGFGALGNGTLKDSFLPTEVTFDVELQTTTTTTASGTTTDVSQETTTTAMEPVTTDTDEVTTSEVLSVTTAEKTTIVPKSTTMAKTTTTAKATTKAPVTTTTVPNTTATEPTVQDLGDVDRSGNIDSSDASIVLQEYALLATGHSGDLTPEQTSSADVNADGSVDSSDASTILRYYAYTATGGKDPFDVFLKS